MEGFFCFWYFLLLSVYSGPQHLFLHHMFPRPNKGLCLEDLRHLLAVDPHVIPEGREKDRGEERKGRAGPQNSALTDWKSSRSIWSPGNPPGSRGVWNGA